MPLRLSVVSSWASVMPVRNKCSYFCEKAIESGITYFYSKSNEVMKSTWAEISLDSTKNFSSMGLYTTLTINRGTQ